jgi:hypothetical protein
MYLAPQTASFNEGEAERPLTANSEVVEAVMERVELLPGK